MAGRGPYAKGVAKREEILQTALDLVARAGYGKATVREIAAAVGLSPTGLLHYFGSKEKLFAEILRRRDRVDIELTRRARDDRSVLDGVAELIRHNAEVPGLVQFYTRFNAEATDPEHEANGYFRERYESTRELFAAAVRHAQGSGELPAGIDPARLAPLLVALSDGLQSQWLYDDGIDMAAGIGYLFELLRVAPPAG